VFTLRCTARLMKRLRPTLSMSSMDPTTRLGDWYANLVHVGRLQLVLGVSERTFLPVVVRAAPISTIASRLRLGLADVLGATGVAKADIAKETAEMESVVYGKTANRQVTGIMVDFAKELDFDFDATQSLLDVSLQLSQTPCGPLYKSTGSPDRETLALFTPRPLRLVR
jgi:hypothetical protein